MQLCDYDRAHPERCGVRIELLHYLEPGLVESDYGQPGPDGQPTARPMNRRGLTHMALRVEGVGELLDRLRAEGFEIIEASRIDNPEFASSVLFVLDPDGVRVELVEMPGDPKQPLGDPL